MNEDARFLPRALQGARTTLPVAASITPFGLVAGAAALEAGLHVHEALAMSLLVFAGAAQLAAIDLIGRGAPALVAVLAIGVVNLRFLLYSAALSPILNGVSRRARALAAYGVTDQAFALTSQASGALGTPRARLAFFTGSALTMWTFWQTSTLAGAFLGARLPASLSLDFAVPLTFLALLAGMLPDRPAWAAAITGGIVSVAAASLPYAGGLMLGALAGVLAGVAADRRRRA